MTRKILFTLMLALLTAGQALAQMSDEEVAIYAKQQLDAGKSQTAIFMDLQKKGVTMEQLMRMKSKYEALSSGGMNFDMSGGDKAVTNSRMRQANGDSLAIATDKVISGAKEIFGHDIFQDKTLSFEPNMNIATPANYILGAGDHVLVDIYGTSQVTQEYDISPEGTVVVEKIGPVAISGLTVEQAQNKIQQMMGQHYQGSHIKVTVGQTRTVVINIMGEVLNPGTYNISAFATVFNALYLAGGISDLGTLRNIKVCRNGRVIAKVDVYDFILNGKLTGNVMLQDNDAIIVGAYDALVNIRGAVKRPMYYEMKEGEALSKLLEYAGDFSDLANPSIINVERKSDNGLKVHDIDIADYDKFALQDGDIVTAKNIIGRYQNMVEVSGSVFYPGHYAMASDCSTIRSLILKAGGLKEDAFANRAVLFRMTEARTRKSMSIDLASILSENAPDVILVNEDSLAIASNEDLHRARKYYIYGPVFHPGAFQYAEDMTLEDAIVAAGGLKEEALTSGIEIARRLQYTDGRDTTYNTKAQIFTFEVENGLFVKDATRFALKPFDVITIKRNPEYADVSVVTVTGEIKYPGSYSLVTNGDRLSDLLKRAGGLTESGFIDGATVTRKLSAAERAQAKLLLEIAHSGDSVDISKIQIKDTYTVGVNFKKALQKPGSDEDLILRSGDVINIPQRNNTVRISGEVLFPNDVPYIEGKSASYYLNQAGGVGEKALKSKAFIIYADGQVSRVRRGDIQPGCEIVVPTKEEKVFDNKTASWLISSVGILSTISAIFIAALR